MAYVGNVCLGVDLSGSDQVEVGGDASSPRGISGDEALHRRQRAPFPLAKRRACFE
jgi:hypothetical protein